MRRDDLYLNDILEAADHIAEFLGEMDFESFWIGVGSKLSVIGEKPRRGSRKP